MKKILGMAGLLIAAVIFAYTFRLKTVGYLDTSVMAVTDRQMAGTLKAGIGEHEDRRLLTLQNYQAAEPLYSRGNRYYLGKEKTQLDISYPFYVNSGTSLYFMTDQTKLITSDFAVFDSYNGLFLSNGKAYTGEDGSMEQLALADDEEYIMTSVGSGVYQNLQPMKLTSDGSEDDFRLNSFLYLDEDKIRAYSYENDALVYTEKPVSVRSQVSIGSLHMDYAEFLSYLKAASGNKSEFITGVDVDQTVPEDTGLNDEHSREEGERQKADAKESQSADMAAAGNSAAGAAGADGANAAAETEAGEQNSEKGSDKGMYPEKATADSMEINGDKGADAGNDGGNGDGSGDGVDSGSGDATGDSSSSGKSDSSSDNSDNSGDNVNDSNSGADPDSGNDDTNGGKHDSSNSGNNANDGQNAGNGSGQGNGTGGNQNNAEDDDVFHEPVITLDTPEMGVYYLKSAIHVEDKDERLVRVVIRAYLDGKQAGRKNLKSDADFEITNLRPGQTYEIKGEMVYRNELGVKVTKPFMENIEVSTKPLSSLAPLTLNFKDADTYATNTITINDVTLTGPKAATESEEVLIDYVSRVKVTVKGYEDQDENLGSTLVRKLRQGEMIDWTSGADFKSDKSYDYKVDVEDRFGNTLQLTSDSRTEGHTRTCKTMPKAVLTEIKNEVGTQTVGVQLSNTDKVSMANLRLKVTDLEGNVLPAFAGSDTYYRELDANSTSRQDIDITMLPTGVNILVIVEADFDLRDKPQANYQTGREIGRINLYTAPISRLGSVYTSIATANLTASSVDITFSIDQNKTLEGLVELMSQARVLISDPDGTIVYNSMVNDGTHLNGVSQSSELVSGKISVGLASNYLFDKERLSGSGWTKENNGAFVIQDAEPVNSVPKVTVSKPGGANYDDPWEALKKGGQVTLSFPKKSDLSDGSFKSMTQYKITIQAVATQAGISHSVGYVANVRNFKTIRQAPVFEYSDAFTIADIYAIYGFRISDPDGTIPGGEVQMRVSTNGSVVMARSITVNTSEPEDLVIPDLRQGSTYLITFMTTLYNEGYDSSTQGEKTFSQQFKFTVGEEASGTIQLNGLDANMKAAIQVAMSGRNGALIDNQYQVEIYGAAGIDTATSKVLENRLDTWSETELPVDMDGFVKLYDLTCKQNWKYILRLVVHVRGYEIVLDDVVFTSEGKIDAYSNWEDLRKAMQDDITGKFVVTQDMVKTNNTVVGSSAAPFNGTLDFQGHTLTTEKVNADGSKSYYPAPIFNYLGSEGVVENLIYDWTWDNSAYSSYHSFYRWGSISQWSWGTIRNVRINLNMSGRQYVDGLGGIVYQNYASGVIENFIVDLKREFYVTKSSGAVCAQNDGQIHNGYVYGDGSSGINSGSGIFGGNKDQTHAYVGCIGNNTSGAQIENVFSLIDVSIENGTNMMNVGGLAGYNAGIVRNSFWVGDIYSYGYNDDKSQTAAQLYRLGGGIVGNRETSGQMEKLYNISLQPDPVDYGMDTGLSNRIRNYASTETIQRLWDFVWYDTVFSSSSNFDVRDQLDAGYYPKLQMSEVMSGIQDDVKLPPSSGVNIPTYISNVVEEQGADWAIVDLYFNNPHLQEIKTLLVENLTAEILDQHSESSFYVVRAKLTDPKAFRSSYRLLNFDYKISENSTTTSQGKPSESAVINVKLYKQLFEANDWSQIITDPVSNYQLAADLDFSNIPTDWMVIRGKSFTGELDGNGHTISNLSPSGNTAYIFDKVSGGTIKNLTVENLNLEVNDTQQAKADALYAGFIGKAESNAVLDHIRLKNVVMDGMPGAAGALVGQAQNTTITNCSAEEVTLTTASYTGISLRTGGLLGETIDSPVQSCYVSSLELTAVKGFSSSGIGGLIGNTSGSGAVSDIYAHGSMKVSFTSVGGAIGRSQTDVSGVWTMVDISSNMGQIGGVVGVMGSGILQHTMAIGDLATTSTSELGRIYGGKTNGSALITLANGVASSAQIFGTEASDVFDSSQNVTALVSTDELDTVASYRDKARLGNNFDLTGDVSGCPVTSGYMPMLFATDGTLLEDQSPVLRKDTRLKITNVNLTANRDGTYTLIVQAATGDSDFQLKGVECDAFALGETTGVQPSGSNASFGKLWRIDYPQVTLQQYLSTYTLSVVFEKTENGKTIEQKLSYQLAGNYYRQISNANEWVTVMSQYGQNFENFEITGNIDLTDVAQTVIQERNLMNLKINALRSGNGGPYTIKGLSYIAQAQSESMIASLSGTMEDVIFENISIDNYSKGLGGVNVGVIGQNNGTIQNVTFKGISINGYAAQRVGSIGQNNGIVQNVTVQDVKITANMSSDSNSYVGGLVGYNTGTLTNITAEGTNEGTYTYRTLYAAGTSPNESDYSYVIIGKDYVGGVLGYSTSPYSDISIKAAYVDGRRYVGGISSWADVGTVKNLTVGDPEDQVKPVTVTGSGDPYANNSYTGGVIGRGPSEAGQGVYTYVRNAKVYNTFVIGQNYTGGLLGTNGNWFVSAYDCFVKHATISGKIFVGGFGGGSPQNYRNYIEDSHISGTTRVGGASGSTGPLGKGYTIKSCIIEGSGTAIGGVVGYHNDAQIINAAVIDSVVKGGSDSQYVGGLAGHSESEIYDSSVLNTKVSGGTAVGGLVGQGTGHRTYRCTSNADVTADSSKAGGVYGELLGFNGKATIGDRQTTKAYDLIIGGTVSAPTMAGGFAGAYSITPPLYDANGNVKLAGSSKLRSDQYYSITLMNKVICTNTAGNNSSTCSVWAYFTPSNSVSSLQPGQSYDYTTQYRINGITRTENDSTAERGAVWSGVKVVDKSDNEIQPLKDYLGDDFKNWDSVKNDTTANKKNVVVHVADMKTTYFWQQQMFNDTSRLVLGKIDNKYDKDVVTAGKAPMFHNQWYVVLAERDADGNPILDKSNNPTGNTKTILPFLDGSETYETLEDGRYVTKQIFPFMLPDASGDNKSWNTTSTQTLTDGENLMVYASDVAAINLEVADEAVNNESPVLLTISDSEGMIFAAPVTQKVYTIPYDFSTTLTAELIQNDTVQQYVINAGDLVHTVMNYDGNYYYMTGSGIRSSAWPEEDAAALNAIADQAADETSESSQDQEQTMIQGLCEGQFLNMWAGKALDINGDIWDLETRTIEENAQIDRDAMAAKAEAVMNASVATLSADGTEDGVSSTQSVIEAMSQLADTESQPLYQFRYGDTTLEVYGKDTISIKNGQSNSLDSLVYVKNGHLYPVDSELDTVTGAVLADAYGDKRYLSVLTSDGSIEDLGNDLTLPSKFKNSSIVELADNLESDSRVAIGRYKNGTAFAFDYITGKVITLYEDEYDTGNDENILDYAKDWIVSKTGSWFGINNSGYRGAQDMINQYQEGGSDGILGQLRQIERTVTTWKDGADTSGSADTKDGSASGTDNLDGSDNASGEGSSDLNNDSAVSTKGSSEDHTDQTGSGTELKDAEAEDKTSVKNASKDTDAHGKHTGDADAEAAGDKKAAGDKAEAQATDKNVDKTVQSAAVNDGAAQAENPADGSDKVQESEVSLGTSDGQKADAKTHDEQTSGELEGAADSENAGNEENADAAEAGQTAEDAGQNAAAENAADGQEDGSDVSGDQEAAQTTDAAGNGQTSAAGSQAAEGSQIAEGAENAEAGQTGEAAENVLAAAEAADAQTSAKAKDQLVSIYNADTKSYEVYDVEDFLSAPKDEIITVSEKVTELTKQGLINNATDLKAEDNKINDTNRYGILIYCGIAATILLLLGYLFNRKWKDWK